MAIGHIWSSILDAETSHLERQSCAEEFHSDRLVAKARMIDALMGPGGSAMLKIDAVSLADTLEGYPDLFVRALLGGGICAEDDGEGDSPIGEELYGGIYDVAYDDVDDGGHVRYRYSSMGRREMVEDRPSSLFHDYHSTSYDVDRDYGHAPPFSDTGDHRVEAIRTMSLFVISSLIPSLALYCVFLLDCDYCHDAGTNVTHRGMLPVLASLSASAIAMFALGAWKR
jgi:hypothetical protein